MGSGSRRFGAGILALVLVVGVGAGILGGRFFKSPSNADPDRAPAAALPPDVVEISAEAQKSAGVQVDIVKTAQVPVTLDITGRVTPPESRIAHIRPLAQGLVEQVHVTVGQRVVAGQALATYDNVALGELIGEYLSEAAILRQTKTDLGVRQASQARAEELIKIEAIAQGTLEVRRAETKNAEAAVASQQARLAKLEEQIHRFGLSDADIAKFNQQGDGTHRTASHNVLKAPFAGIITKLDVAVGEFVEPDRELFTLMDLSTVWVLADVYERDLTRVRADVAATVTTEAYANRVFNGRVTYVSDTIDPKTRTAALRGVFANSDGALKLEMFVKMSVPTAERRESLVIPVAAVQRIDDKPLVFVRRADGKFERRDVTLGSEAGGLIEVRSGLKDGDAVVGAGSFYLKTAALRERIGGE